MIPTANDRRTQRIYIRVSEHELTLIQKNAAAAGLSLSRYARQRLLLKPVSAIPAEELILLRRELSGLCSNANQIARAVNSHAREPCKAAEETLTLARQAYDLLRRRLADGV